MTKTANRQRKVQMPSNIRKKFAVAICMLLIASIMMISSSYAWFTLSTAPEVTGITTNVGANGNLEIALLTPQSFLSTADDLGISTGVGDSMAVKNVTEANITWGNLVDLSDPSYGLGSIVLNPAALNFNDNTIAGGLGTSLLLAPSYGSDGRVINVQKTPVFGTYNSSTGAFAESQTAAGVRAIGVSSGITLRISSYRAAVASIQSYLNAAKSAAQASLVSRGQDLANMLIAYAADSNYKISATDIDALDAVLTNLEDANAQIATAIRQAALAYTLSSANNTDLTDDEVNALVTAAQTAAITSGSVAGLNTNADINSAITEYLSINANVASAKDALDDYVAGETSYTEASAVTDNLINKQYVSVAGQRDIGRDDVSSLASAVISQGYIGVEMEDGSGIYAQIAKLVGNYTASGLKISGTFSGITVEDLPAKMTTKVTAPYYLVSAITTAAAGEYTGSASASTSVDDTLGYVLDFGVRTNAAGSNLLLQREASQRIYNGEDNAFTQGGGTYIEFTTGNKEVFTVADVENLMSALRVVFVTPNDTADGYDILGIAAPQITTAMNNETGMLVPTINTDYVTVDNEAGTVKAQLLLYDLNGITITEIVQDKEYSMTLGALKGSSQDVNETPEDDSDDVFVPDFTLTSLEQNKAKKISVLVYIDGDIVDNTMVANARTSVTGNLNLQFASSAELKPMDVQSAREATDTVELPSAGVSTAQLSKAVGVIKLHPLYLEAVAISNDEDPATDLTTEQSNLLAKVAAADAVLADSTADQTAVNNAATQLAAAASAAGLTVNTGSGS